MYEAKMLAQSEHARMRQSFLGRGSNQPAETEASHDNAIVDAKVQYSTYPGCSRKFFRCQACSAVLSVEVCAERFTRAQTATADELNGSSTADPAPLERRMLASVSSRFFRGRTGRRSARGAERYNKGDQQPAMRFLL